MATSQVKRGHRPCCGSCASSWVLGAAVLFATERRPRLQGHELHQPAAAATTQHGVRERRPGLLGGSKAQMLPPDNSASSETDYGTILPGNALDAFYHMGPVVRTFSLAELQRDAASAPLFNYDAVRAATAAHSADVMTAGSSPSHSTASLRSCAQSYASNNGSIEWRHCAPGLPPQFRRARLLPKIRGFEDDADVWSEIFHALCPLNASRDQEKRPMATDRLRHTAKAWNTCEGMKKQSWAEWSTKVIAAFVRLPHVSLHHAAPYETRERHLPTGKTVLVNNVPAPAGRASEGHRLDT